MSEKVVLNLYSRRTLAESLQGARFQKGVEIGVRLGWYSKYLLDNTEMHMDCIDPWEANLELKDAQYAYDFCANLLQPYIEEGRCRMVKAYSPQISAYYEDGSLDFIYIDGLHDYESVKADLEAWCPKLRPQRLLCGHDYNPTKWPGVVQAVEEFCATNNLQKALTGIVGNARASRTGDIDEFDGNEQSFIIFAP
tara:strand:- start:83 stop:667 length:585 start_codon:yes stop_codon:yes gene_type:complete